MSAHRPKLILHTLISLAFLAGLLSSPLGIISAHASTLTVTSASDSGAGSLRQAILDAAPNDTINFDPGLSGATIYLASTLTLTKNVTIDGSALASQITISGDTDNNGSGNVRVLTVNSSVSATLISLTIVKGANAIGAGINNGGTLYVTGSLIYGNSAVNAGGGIYNLFATLIITNSAIYNNSVSNNITGKGAGILNSGGTVTVTNSTFLGNSTRYGGGLYNYSGSTASVTNSTFSGNSASFGGGGIYNDGTLTVTNSTFSGNSGNPNDATSGGGIENFSGTLNYANTIVANSTIGGDCDNDSGTIGTNTNNLVEDGSCAAALSGDPNLAALAYNGGYTYTFDLIYGSPAIDAGNDAVCAAAPVNNLDQRGLARPYGAHCDIGAYEDQGSTPPSLVVTNTNDSGAGSLRDTIAGAGVGNTITFDPALSGATIRIATSLLLERDVTIDGSALASQITISGDTDNNGTGNVRVFSVGSAATTTLNSLVITKGVSASGSGIVNNGTLTLVNCTLSGNSASAGGGGLYSYGPLVITGSTFSNNSANAGGGLFNSGLLTITGSTFSDNSAATDGGALFDFAGTQSITNSAFSGNSAAYGGGVFHNGGTLSITSSTLSGNSTTTHDGGGIYNASDLTITNSTLSGNSAAAGGGIVNWSNLTMTNSTLSGNSATVSGGGLYNGYHTFSPRPITNSTFSGNSAGWGGGIFNDGDLVLTNNTLSGNSAVNAGGGIYNYTGTLNYANTLVANSSSGGDCFNNASIGTDTNNLVEDGSCFASLSGDPNLGALANNGGPTQTFALPFGSTATDAGDDTVCAATVGYPAYGAGALDQRGTLRPQGAHCDVGAYEYVPVIAPEINLKGNGNSITAGDTTPSLTDFTDFGGADVSSGTVDRTFTIENLGTVALTLGGTPKVSLGGTNAGDFSVSAAPAGSVPAGGSTTFTVHFDPSAAGTRSATVSIANNDGDENPYTFDIQGTGTLSSAKDLTAFGIASPAATGVISGTNIAVSVPLGTNLTALVATFTTTGVSVAVGAAPQVSGTTPNDFTSPVSYTVTAADSTTKTYTVTVTVAADSTAPQVVSSARIDASPTAAATVDFSIVFSEPVSGVDAGDFSLAASGVSGASVTGVSGTGATYTVTVNTGSGNGSLRLDVVDNDSIADAASNKLGGTGLSNGNFSSGEVYTVDKTVTVTLNSTNTQDGWILETGENTSVGGTLNSKATTFLLGDDKTRKQYRAVLSFNTGPGLPDNAHITSVTLKLKKSAIAGGGNPVTSFKGFMLDVKTGAFGTSALQISDFQAKAGKTFGPFLPVPVSNWYSIDLTGTAGFINALSSGGGLTQIRLRFKLDDNNNAVANTLSIFSGNAPLANRPELVISYYVP